MAADFPDVHVAHAWRKAGDPLPVVRVAARVDPRLERSAALRLPLDMPRPTVRSLDLSPPKPSVRSYRFERPASPSAATPPGVAAVAVCRESGAASEGETPPPRLDGPAPKRTRITP
ncbi:MAG: hypothetical protein ACKOTB_19380, partial [Planctomycetia bacterium]